ncbi:MAG TPA: hypothetical protein VGA21_08035, partial [Cyclobacteriaceae bacterium]
MPSPTCASLSAVAEANSVNWPEIDVAAAGHYLYIVVGSCHLGEFKYGCHCFDWCRGLRGNGFGAILGSYLSFLNLLSNIVVLKLLEIVNLVALNKVLMRETQKIIDKIESSEDCFCITLINGQKNPPNLFPTQIALDILPILYELLEGKGKVKKIALVIRSNGGIIDAPLPVINLLKEYCETLSI